MSKKYAYLHTMAKIYVKFQNGWAKTVGELRSQDTHRPWPNHLWKFKTIGLKLEEELRSRDTYRL